MPRYKVTRMVGVLPYDVTGGSLFGPLPPVSG